MLISCGFTIFHPLTSGQKEQEIGKTSWDSESEAKTGKSRKTPNCRLVLECQMYHEQGLEQAPKPFRDLNCASF